MKNYSQENNEEYFLEFDVQYPEKLHEHHNDLPILPERMKNKKVTKVTANKHDKTEHLIHVTNLK